MGKVCFAVGSEAGEQPSFIDGSSSKAVRKVPFTLDVVKPLIRTLAVEKESEVCSCIGALENLAIYTNPECLMHCMFFFILGIPRISSIYLAQERETLP